MRRQNVIRAFLFAVFFSIGAAALSGSILCDDVVRYYHNRRLLQVAEETLRRLKSLNADYDALLEQLREEPNLVERLGPAALGTEPDDKETVYPKVKLEQLAAAKKALTQHQKRLSKALLVLGEPELPEWIRRCNRPGQRVALFLAGASLILVSFIWFGPAPASNKQRPAKENSGVSSQAKNGANLR